MMPNSRTEVVASDITSALSQSVQLHRERAPSSIYVRVTRPVLNLDEVPEHSEGGLDAWKDGLHFGPRFDQIEDVSLGRNSPKNGLDTVEGWADDRIREQLCGEYWNRSKNDIEGIIERLRDVPPGQTQNALISNIFQRRDLQRALPVPCQRGLPCVSHLQFVPNRGTLDLSITLRSQYLGLKGFGNLAGASALLAYVAKRAGYEVGELRVLVNNVTTHDGGSALERLYHSFNE